MAYKATRVQTGHVQEPDQVALLAEAAERWRECGLDFDSMVAYAMDGTAHFIGCPKDFDVACKCIARYGWDLETSEAIFVEGDDEPGAILPVADKLARAGVNIQMLNCGAVGGKFSALLTVAPADYEKACEALGI